MLKKTYIQTLVNNYSAQPNYGINAGLTIEYFIERQSVLDKIGVESIVVIGSATDSEGKIQNHAWNYVRFNNAWYAVDATWDDPIIIGGGTLTTKHRYKYFLKGSETINTDHIAANTFVNGGKTYTHPTLSVKDYE